jgi:hypothetical protein
MGLSSLSLKDSFFEINIKRYLKAGKFLICSSEYFVENKEAERFVEEFTLSRRGELLFLI